MLKGGWCSIIILNLQAPIEDKSFKSKKSSCNELQQIFDDNLDIFRMLTQL